MGIIKEKLSFVVISMTYGSENVGTKYAGQQSNTLNGRG